MLRNIYLIHNSSTQQLGKENFGHEFSISKSWKPLIYLHFSATIGTRTSSFHKQDCEAISDKHINRFKVGALIGFELRADMRIRWKLSNSVFRETLANRTLHAINILNLIVSRNA